jgi:hypothetical protein
MFAKNKVSQSLVDAVNKIMSEKEEETKEQLLSEGWDDMLKSVKDKNKPQPSGGAGKKQGSRYGGSKQKEEPEEKEVKEELKGNQHKIDKNKNNKIDAEDFKMLRKEELKGDQHKIDANKNNKIDAHDFQLLRGRKKVKEDTFAGKLLNSLVESEEIQKAINEVMKKDATAGDWIHDFVHSDNPRFDGKSTKERQKMALGAYYAKQNEEVELNEITQADIDKSAEKEVSHAKKNGWKVEKQTYGRTYTHPKHGHIDMDRYGEWQHRPKTGIYRGKGDLIAHGQSVQDLDKHISTLKEEIELDEAAPKKNDDAMAGKQNLTPAKKGVVGTVKSDFKNFKNFLAGKKETNEEVESLDEDRYLMKYLLSRGINPKYVDRNTRVGHAKSNEFKKWKADHLNSLIITRESNEMPFEGPYTKTKKNVKDKSGAVHTPMSRAKDLARSALKSVQDKTKIKN